LSVSVMTSHQPRPFVMAHTSNQWSSGICDCCQNVPECEWALLSFCYTKHGECLCLPLLDGFGCIPPITMAMRVSVRNRYGIQGTICNDCLYSTFCGVCAWCQMSREMNVHEQNVNLVHNRAK
uniref:Plac8 onzin related protein 5 n=1 Tax=Sinocyclocheilus grahami TaxID=75366 RepID=A0A672PKQ0_SINGR